MDFHLPVAKGHDGLAFCWAVQGYVAWVMQFGTRLFCKDRGRDEWTDRFLDAEVIPTLHEATQAAARRHGEVEAWRDAYMFEAS
ncbi:MAG: hypothetical protein QOD77_1073 [Thermoplasmata archaeon]|nr:hypothetical protein [Thermoplasmata archaeon]